MWSLPTWTAKRGHAPIGRHLFAVPVDRLRTTLSFGPIAERVLWLIHHTVRDQRIPQLLLAKSIICEWIWGASQTRRSLQTLQQTLASLAKLRVGEWPDKDGTPPLEQSLPLFEQITKKADSFEFVVDEGFLGSLEQFAVEQDGQVTYEFPTRKKLRTLRVSQQLQDVYLPIYLGDFAVCKRFRPRQKRLFQAVVNELTYPPRTKDDSQKKVTVRSLESAAIIAGDRVVGYGGKGVVECSCLEPLMNYVGFNGNGVRRGQGYKLVTWMKKAGYSAGELRQFIEDLLVLCDELGLRVSGIGKGLDTWRSLSDIGVLAASGGLAQRKLDELHVRMYAKADCFESWNQFFRWHHNPEVTIAADQAEQTAGVLEKLRGVLHAKHLQQKQVAEELEVTKQHLSAVLTGKKSCSAGLRKRIQTFVASHAQPADGAAKSPIEPPKFDLVHVSIAEGSSTLQNAALQILRPRLVGHSHLFVGSQPQAFRQMDTVPNRTSHAATGQRLVGTVAGCRHCRDPRTGQQPVLRRRGR